MLLYDISHKNSPFTPSAKAFVRFIIQSQPFRRSCTQFCMIFHTKNHYLSLSKRYLYDFSYKVGPSGGSVFAWQDLLASGTSDLDKTLPEFLDKLKKAGAEKIVAEKQRQLDEWRKTNV
ncbi:MULTISPECIES: DUF3502 domain-containing protein [Cohnella]|uniref:DUF3502 domain-containing protein n=1 Tax=Cohnella TaxID=329857 RepID=UPI0011188056|nr:MULTISPECIES: DUF3502 domain-containing protein [Cohnella]MBN2983815.1 DUF3502 domain-containing protein [Cohnella algarum]